MVMKHTKEALMLLVDQWLDDAETLWAAGQTPTTDLIEHLDRGMADTLRRCAVQLRSVLKEM